MRGALVRMWSPPGNCAWLTTVHHVLLLLLLLLLFLEAGGAGSPSEENAAGIKYIYHVLLLLLFIEAGGAGGPSDENAARIKYLMSHYDAEEDIHIEGNQIRRRIYNNQQLVWDGVNTFGVPSTKQYYIGTWTVEFYGLIIGNIKWMLFHASFVHII